MLTASQKAEVEQKLKNINEDLAYESELKSTVSKLHAIQKNQQRLLQRVSVLLLEIKKNSLINLKLSITSSYISSYKASSKNIDS